MPAPRGVIVLTGIMVAGKSTIAQMIAERLPRSTHVRDDLFRRMIVSGRAEPLPGLPYPTEHDQIQLRCRLSAATADSYADAGFTAVVQDIILGCDPPRYLDLLRSRPRYLMVLAPRPDVVAERERGRGKSGYTDGWMPTGLDRELRATPRLGHWLDSSRQTAEQAADAVLASLDQARIDPA